MAGADKEASSRAAMMTSILMLLSVRRGAAMINEKDAVVGFEGKEFVALD